MVKVASEGFGKEVRKVVHRWDLFNIDNPRLGLQKVVDIMMSNINVFYLAMVFGRAATRAVYGYGRPINGWGRLDPAPQPCRVVKIVLQNGSGPGRTRPCTARHGQKIANICSSTIWVIVFYPFYIWRIRICCLTSMRNRIVSGLRLARRKDIVSRPPENILSTATADPVEKRKS